MKRWTYNMLVAGINAFFIVIKAFEEAFPFSMQTPPSQADEAETIMTNPIFSGPWALGSPMFSIIPDNPQLRALVEKIDNRLLKILYTRDINGVFRQMPLFEQSIDPALLVQATTQGVLLSSVVSDLNAPMPNLRFHFLLQKALDMGNEVKSLGQVLLAAREKAGGEALSNLHTQHHVSTQTAMMEMKRLALGDVTKVVETLQQSCEGVASRLR
ncbi:hypothetical protein B0T24DRAFT_618541 [Lasiosphaeria ovina]|uniref:Uncharacterized protein n=1 Tax=Lasiosphaeria ovina TaxID=92902 RepID=A0AAE0KGZ1_9PEZI|nr:hypothetical protein B0T24DRAFT_618541 [Lasiosphaeria ovina]